MKNNVRNALNALGLLGFMALAWATSKAQPVEPINMQVKINADSTAFFLTNLDNIDYDKGNIELIADSAVASKVLFLLDSINVKAKAVDTLSFSRFKHFVDKTAFSKRLKPKNFTFIILPHPVKKEASGAFFFTF